MIIRLTGLGFNLVAPLLSLLFGACAMVVMYRLVNVTAGRFAANGDRGSGLLVHGRTGDADCLHREHGATSGMFGIAPVAPQADTRGSPRS